MEETYKKLLNNDQFLGANEILDNIIAFQIKKMYKHDKQRILSESSEKAMENLIKLLEIRYKRIG